MEEQIKTLKAVVENLDNRIDDLSTELLKTRDELRNVNLSMKSLEKRIINLIDVLNIKTS
jgi:chromosome segregation ATPase